MQDIKKQIDRELLRVRWNPSKWWDWRFGKMSKEFMQFDEYQIGVFGSPICPRKKNHMMGLRIYKKDV